MTIHCLLALTLGCAVIGLTGCGGGGGGTAGGMGTPPDQNVPGEIPLNLGSPALDLADIPQGVVKISFPDAVGDGPVISAADVKSGVATADLGSGSWPVATDGVVVYLPRAGSHTILLTVNDAGDAPRTVEVPVTVPQTEAFALSGTVKDDQVGVKTGISLLWQPLASRPQVLAANKDSAASSGGSFTFDKLVGGATAFSVAVDGGTK